MLALPASAQTEASQQAVQGACAAALIGQGYRDVVYGPVFEDKDEAGAYLIVTGRKAAEPSKTFLCRLKGTGEPATLTRIPDAYKITISDRGTDQIEDYIPDEDE